VSLFLNIQSILYEKSVVYSAYVGFVLVESVIHEKSTKKMLMAMEILVLPIIEKNLAKSRLCFLVGEVHKYKSTKFSSHVSSTSVSGILQKNPLRVRYAGCLAGMSIVQVHRIKSR
jgi:hypothetical protein